MKPKRFHQTNDCPPSNQDPPMLYSNLPHRYDFYRPSLSCHVISWKSYITKLSSIGMSIHPYVLLTSFAPITATVIVMQTIAITSGTYCPGSNETYIQRNG